MLHSPCGGGKPRNLVKVVITRMSLLADFYYLAASGGFFI